MFKLKNIKMSFLLSCVTTITSHFINFTPQIPNFRYIQKVSNPPHRRCLKNILIVQIGNVYVHVLGRRWWRRICNLTNMTPAWLGKFFYVCMKIIQSSCSILITQRASDCCQRRFRWLSSYDINLLFLFYVINYLLV